MNGEFQGTGYSGRMEGRNEGTEESTPNVGPIPRGLYSIAPARYSERLGPLVMNLDPIGHDALGRTNFRIHGDNKTHDASHGCIVLGPAIRKTIAESGINKLEVV